MPRSERLYTFLLVGIMSIVVLVSIVGGIRTLRSDGGTARPAYEKTPPTAFVPAPSTSIVNLGNVNRAPVDDDEFLLFHKTTRLLTPLATDRGMQEARGVVVDQNVVASANRKLNDFKAIISGQRSTAAKNIDVTNPVSRVCDLSTNYCQKYCPPLGQGSVILVCRRARTSATVNFIRRTTGDVGAPSTVSVNWEWVKTPTGWKVVDITPQLVSAGEDTTIELEDSPSAEDTGTPTDDTSTDGTDAEPADPNAPVISP